MDVHTNILFGYRFMLVVSDTMYWEIFVKEINLTNILTVIVCYTFYMCLVNGLIWQLQLKIYF